MKIRAMIQAVAVVLIAASTLVAEPVEAKRIEVILKSPDSIGFLGVILEDTDEDGVLITQLMAGSPADKAGLKAGDRIVALDGKFVEGAGALAKTVRGLKPETKVKVTIIRDKKKKVVTVTLGLLFKDQPMPPQWQRQPPRLPIPLPVPKFIPIPPRIFQHDGVRVLVWGLPREAREKLEGKIREWIKQYKAAQPKPAYLGVGITKAEEGLRVISVDLDSPAGKIGVRAGDLIVRIDDETLDDPAAFVKTIRAKKPGDTVTLVIHRGKLRTEVLVKLAEKPKRPRSLLTPPCRRWRRHMWPYRIHPRHDAPHYRQKEGYGKLHIPEVQEDIYRYRWEFKPGEKAEGMKELQKQLRDALEDTGELKEALHEQIEKWLKNHPGWRAVPDANDEGGEESDETEK